jgi:hypothetical protein
MNPSQSGGPGFTATYSSLYDNTGGSRDVLVQTVWVSFYTNTSDLDFQFLYGWPSKVAAYGTAGSDIFSLKIKPGANPTQHYGYSALVGGYNPGDYHDFVSDKWTLDVQRGPTAVPEPATLLGFGLPMLMIGLGKLRGLRK